MQTENDTSKPEPELKQETGEGCSGATCSASFPLCPRCKNAEWMRLDQSNLRYSCKSCGTTWSRNYLTGRNDCSAFWDSVTKTAAKIIETLPKCGGTSLCYESNALKKELERLIGIMVRSATKTADDSREITPCPHCGHDGWSRPYGMNPEIYECNKCAGTWHSKSLPNAKSAGTDASGKTL
jgi:transposase-like protein